MINNLSAYSFPNNTDLCTLGVCFDVASGALTTGVLDPQTGQTRDGGYSPPPISLTYTPQEIDDEDSISLASYLSEASTVSVNLSTTSTCVNLATGYDMFNFGYQLLIREKGQILDKSDSYNYINTSNIVCRYSLVSNWRVLSSTLTYNKMLSGSAVDRLPVGSYQRTTFPNDIITLNYYLPTEYLVPPVFWPGELLNVYKTKKIVWDMSSIRLGGEELKNTFIPFNRNETTYIVDQPRDITQYDPKELLYIDKDFSLSAIKIGSDITSGRPGEQTGNSIDINEVGNRVVVGSVAAPNTNNIGIVQIYELTNSVWVQMGQTLSGVNVCDNFGFSVSMNYTGDRIAVGYYNSCGFIFDRRGTTKIYEWNGAQWIQLGSDIRGLIIDDYSGWSVQLNSAGNRVVISEPYGVAGPYSEYGFSTIRVFEYNGSAWIQVGQTLGGGVFDSPIRQVSINGAGDIIACASEGEDIISGVTGVVKVYKWDGVQWNSIGNITGDVSNFNLGRSLSMNLAGDVLATGAYTSDPNARTVCVYEYKNLEWLRVGDAIIGPGVFNRYGDSLSLNYTGNRLAIGNYLGHAGDIGLVYVYEFDGVNWKAIVNTLSGYSGSPSNSRYFGYSVGLNKLGDRIAIGSPNDSSTLSYSRSQVYDLPLYPLLTLSSFEAYKSVVLWSDGVVTENLFTYPFYLPDGTYGSTGGVINFRKFTSMGEYTILSNTFYYKNILGLERVLTEPYNITFVVS